MKDLVNDESLFCESLSFYKRIEPVFQEINNYMTKPNSGKVNNIFREKDTQNQQRQKNNG